MSNETACTSCKRKVTNAEGTVMFSCPSCKSKLIRCGPCRAIGAAYKCSCGFTGPN